MKQAGENDNISTLYVVDEEDKVLRCHRPEGISSLPRADENLEKLIARNYPYVTDHERSATASTASWTTPSVRSPC